MIQTPPKRLLATFCLALLTVTAGCGFIAGSGGQPTPTAAAGTDEPTPTERVAPTETSADTPSVTATGTSEGSDTATPTVSETPEPEQEGVSVDGNLSFDATAVLERVEQLHGVDVDPPNVVVGETRPITAFGTPFYQSFRVTGTLGAAGQANRRGSLFISSEISHSEVVLAHEFAHHVHSQVGWYPTGLSSVSDDEQRAAGAVFEGAATYTADRYVVTYDDTLPTNSELHQTDYGRGSPAFRLFVAPYMVGSDYIEAQVDSPSELEPVLRDPPATTEQLLHPQRNVSLGNLTVQSHESRDWALEFGHYASDADRRGELLVRELLRLELDRERADAAANGWDNDRSLTFTSTADENETGVAWTIRLENASEADELAAPFETFAERRAANTNSSFAGRRVAPETVVVLAGNESFVDGTTVSGTNESVRVTPPGTDETAASATAKPALVG